MDHVAMSLALTWLELRDWSRLCECNKLYHALGISSAGCGFTFRPRLGEVLTRRLGSRLVQSHAAVLENCRKFSWTPPPRRFLSAGCRVGALRPIVPPGILVSAGGLGSVWETFRALNRLYFSDWVTLFRLDQDSPVPASLRYLGGLAIAENRQWRAFRVMDLSRLLNLNVRLTWRFPSDAQCELCCLGPKHLPLLKRLYLTVAVDPDTGSRDAIDLGELRHCSQVTELIVTALYRKRPRERAFRETIGGSFLRDMPALSALVLKHSDLTTQTAQELARHPSLSELVIDSCDVVDPCAWKDVRPNLPRLREFSVKDTVCSSPWLCDFIDQGSPALETLTIDGTVSYCHPSGRITERLTVLTLPVPNPDLVPMRKLSTVTLINAYIRHGSSPAAWLAIAAPDLKRLAIRRVGLLSDLRHADDLPTRVAEIHYSSDGEPYSREAIAWNLAALVDCEKTGDLCRRDQVLSAAAMDAARSLVLANQEGERKRAGKATLALLRTRGTVAWEAELELIARLLPRGCLAPADFAALDQDQALDHLFD